MVMILTFFAWVNALSVAAPPPDFSDGPAWLSSSESAVDFLASSLCPSPSLQPQPPSICATTHRLSGDLCIRQAGELNSTDVQTYG